MGAIHAALHWVGENIFIERSLADTLGDVLLFGKRLSRGFVLDEFDAKEQAEAANFTYMGVRRQLGEFRAQSFTGGRDALPELMQLDVIEDGIARGRRDWMRLIGEAVLEGAGTALECPNHARRHEDSAQRRITAGDSLPYENDIGLNVPVLNRERLSGAAHAAHDFIGN
jgi:hypothetical protein